MKAAVIGLGSAGRQHIQAYIAEGVEVYALCDTDTDLLERIGIEVEVQQISENFEDILPEVDFVSVCSPDQFHMKQAYTALMAGKAVMCEKPPCLNRQDMELLRNVNGKFAVNLPLPWNETYNNWKIPQDVYNLELAYHWGRKEKLKGWRAGQKYSLVLGGGLHMIDLGLYLTGLEFRNGAAFGTNISTGHDNFDTVQSVFSLSNGGVGRLTINGGYTGPHEHVVSISTPDGIETRSTDKVDKQRPIREFIKAERVDNTRLWRAMETCFNIEDSAWSQ